MRTKTATPRQKNRDILKETHKKRKHIETLRRERTHINTHINTEKTRKIPKNIQLHAKEKTQTHIQ